MIIENKKGTGQKSIRIRGTAKNPTTRKTMPAQVVGTVKLVLSYYKRNKVLYEKYFRYNKLQHKRIKRDKSQPLFE